MPSSRDRPGVGSGSLSGLLTCKALESLASAFSLQPLAPCTDSWHSDTSLLRSKQISVVKAFFCLLLVIQVFSQASQDLPAGSLAISPVAPLDAPPPPF